jgi:hypothetical protein
MPNDQRHGGKFTANLFEHGGHWHTVGGKLPLKFYNNTVTVNAFNTTDWQSQQFTAEALDDPAISGPNADPDGDELPNQGESTRGKSPSQANVNAAPVLNIQSGALALNSTRRNDVHDWGYPVELSADLKTWVSNSDNPQQIAVPRLDAMHERVTEDDKTLLTAGVGRFMRVRVVQRGNISNVGVQSM